MDNAAEDAAAGRVRSAIYFDGKSSRRWAVVLAFGEQLEISAEDLPPVLWPYSDIRRVDGAPGALRAGCLSAPPLARIEIRDPSLAAELALSLIHI